MTRTITERIDDAIERIREFNLDLGGSDRGRTPKRIHLDLHDMAEWRLLTSAMTYRDLDIKPCSVAAHGSRVFNACGHPFTIHKDKAQKRSSNGR